MDVWTTTSSSADVIINKNTSGDPPGSSGSDIGPCGDTDLVSNQPATCDDYARLLSTQDFVEDVPSDIRKINTFPADPEFQELINEAEAAIEARILPQLIAQGSSGSYFVLNSQKDTIGVFKPRSEEPYSAMNPKYTKWCQKKCCPCCFGRTCLIPNQGYISEAAASLVSDLLFLDIVPKTKVVWLASESFYYSRLQRAKVSAKREILAKTPKLGKKFKRIGLPLKIGSFQAFVSGYKSADFYMRQFIYETLPSSSRNALQFQFEKLVCLDYIIRNTDRGNDNWLIRYDVCESDPPDQSPAANGDWGMVNRPKIDIAAIDNGLAFPYKHPDAWRTYPFQWAWLQPYADQPFSQQIVDLVLPLISDLCFVESMTDSLEEIFRLDSQFSLSMFECQMGVVRGQLMNLCEALSKRLTPAQLVELPLRTVVRRKMPRPVGQFDPSQFKEKFHKKKPFFAWC